jgi:hypothetical protein
MKYIHRILNLVAGFITWIMVIPTFLLFVFLVALPVALTRSSIHYIKHGTKLSSTNRYYSDLWLSDIIEIIFGMPSWIIENIGPRKYVCTN